MTGHDSTGVEWVQLWDGRRWPGRVRGGLPEFRFGQAPSGLSTRRQLRERGLSGGGQEPFARLTWKRDKRFAWLYVDEKAKAKRTPSDKQLAAVNKALAARKVCAECGPVDHFVRTTDQLCGDCHAAGVTPTAGGTAGWRTVQAWQTEAADETDDEAERDEASAAAGRAAAALARKTGRLDAADQAGSERDEQLARWHADDESVRTAARLAAERADTHDRTPGVGREGSGLMQYNDEGPRHRRARGGRRAGPLGRDADPGRGRDEDRSSADRVQDRRGPAERHGGVARQHGRLVRGPADPAGRQARQRARPGPARASDVEPVRSWLRLPEQDAAAVEAVLSELLPWMEIHLPALRRPRGRRCRRAGCGTPRSSRNCCG